jgi:hypothetical protein
MWFMRGLSRDFPIWVLVQTELLLMATTYTEDNGSLTDALDSTNPLATISSKRPLTYPNIISSF